MDYSVAKQELYDKLGIKDGRSLTVRNFLDLQNELKSYDPETRKKIIDLVPGYNSMMEKIGNNYSEFAKLTLEKDSISENQFYCLIDKNLESSNSELSRDDITSEERLQIRDHQMEMLRMAFEKDTESKNWKLKLHDRWVWIIGIASVATLSVIGTRANGSNNQNHNNHYVN